MAKKKVTEASTNAEFQEALALEQEDPIITEEPEIVDEPNPEDEYKAKLEELKKETEAAKLRAEEQERRAEALERKAAEASAKASNAELSAFQQQEMILQREYDAANVEISVLEHQLTQAMEEGNTKLVIEAQRKLARAEMRLANVESNISQYEQAKQYQPQTPAQPQITPDVQQWLAANPQFNTDMYFRNAALTAQEVATSQGYVPGTKASIAFVDAELKRLGYIKEVVEPAAPRQTASAQAAPVTRDYGNDSRPAEKHRLSKAEVDYCKRNGMDPVKYLQGKINLATTNSVLGE